MKRLLWKILGSLSLGIAYLGVITPGLPYSIWVISSAYCFSKGSPRLERWLYSHRLFGPFLINWSNKRIFPKKIKFFMVFMMFSSLIIMYASGATASVMITTIIGMLLVVLWVNRFPGSTEEWVARKDAGKKIGWIR